MGLKMESFGVGPLTSAGGWDAPREVTRPTSTMAITHQRPAAAAQPHNSHSGGGHIRFGLPRSERGHQYRLAHRRSAKPRDGGARAGLQRQARLPAEFVGGLAQVEELALARAARRF